jgi:stress response protein YsnF
MTEEYKSKELIFSSSSPTSAISNNDNSDTEINNADVEVIPVFTEKYTISKKVVTEDFTIERRMIEGIATIRVPIKYEEIYVNGKKFGSSGIAGGGSSNNSLGSILSSIKGAITNNKDEKTSKQQQRQEEEQERINKQKAALKGELVPLSNGVPEQILPLFGEEIIIKKRMKQVAKAVITKRRITENKKFSIKTKGEKVMIRYPDGTERTLESTAPSPSLMTTTNDATSNSGSSSTIF